MCTISGRLSNQICQMKRRLNHGKYRFSRRSMFQGKESFSFIVSERISTIDTTKEFDLKKNLFCLVWKRINRCLWRCFVWKLFIRTSNHDVFVQRDMKRVYQLNKYRVYRLSRTRVWRKIDRHLQNQKENVCVNFFIELEKVSLFTTVERSIFVGTNGETFAYPITVQMFSFL